MRGLVLMKGLVGLVREMEEKIGTGTLWRTFWRLSFLDGEILLSLRNQVMMIIKDWKGGLACRHNFEEQLLLSFFYEELRAVDWELEAGSIVLAGSDNFEEAIESPEG
ncbi:MAG: hypothetical protein J7621_21835 [Niastella sp.]|nr:hypothetical protein [Niastella sp.]